MKFKAVLPLFLIFLLALGNVQGQSYIPNVTEHTLYSKFLGYTMKFNVYVPSKPYINYFPQQNKKFNVVYVLDGGIPSKLFDLVVANFNYMNEDMYYNYPPFIVVGIVSSPKRAEEFTPMTTDKKTLNRTLFKRYGYGKADAYLSFMEKELFPYIKSHYNVSGDRVGIGHSLGGTLMLHALNTNKNLFNAYFLFSPNLQYGSRQLIQAFAQKYPKNSEINRLLYISVGDIGYENYFKPGINELDSIVKANHYGGFPFVYDSLEDCDHLFSPQRSLPLALQAYKKLYQPPTKAQREQFLESRKGFLNGIKNFYAQKEKMLGYVYYPGIDIINNQFVGFLLDKNKTDQALKTINWGIRLYPENYFSYSLYMTKADVLVKKKDLNGALHACEDGFSTLESVKSHMTYGDYSYAHNLLVKRINELKKKLGE